jgi:hypothetical protein
MNLSRPPHVVLKKPPSPIRSIYVFQQDFNRKLLRLGNHKEKINGKHCHGEEFCQEDRPIKVPGDMVSRS